ncbi:VOC family protein [Phenylobacterium sp.]|uniref:VOC family protein n=1 Tax=Phenylobacterium sp. TaxID=1871053 RepID=UPI0027350D71|nr:VOC family protein [Phenylobacterium sp.]MDP3852677.1 VOC family protein [Phenylobacterium sp.]
MARVVDDRIGSLAELTAQLAIELRVSNLAASIDFYGKAGLVLERRTPTFAAMHITGRYLLLSATPDVAAGPTPPNLRIVVDDADQAFASAVEMGWTPKYALEDRGYGLRDFTVTDPDGYEVRFAALSAR